MSNAEGLRELYTALGGDITTLPEDITNAALLAEIAKIAGGGGGGDGISIDDLCASTISGDFEIKADRIKARAFENNAGDEPLNLVSDTVTAVEANAFFNCSNIHTVSLTACEAFLGESSSPHSANTFSNSGIYSANLPVLSQAGPRAFEGCANLEEAYVPELITGDYCFRNCSKLKVLLLRRATELPAFMAGTSGLKVLALGSESVVTTPANALSNTPIATGHGYVLVPDALRSGYETATNWVGYKNSGTQYLALEDYTVDGTIAGDLDPEKIAPLLEN